MNFAAPGWKSLTRTTRNAGPSHRKPRRLAIVTAVRLLAFVALCAGGSPVRAQDEASRLLTHLPQQTNVIAVVRVRELFQSPRARREGWQEKREEEYVTGAAALPPQITTYMRSGTFRPGNTTLWTHALLSWPSGFSLKELATREATVVQKIAAREAVLSQQRDAYFVELAKGVMGVVSPASRQDVARWTPGPATTSPVSDSLVKSLNDTTYQVVFALDLVELLDPHALTAALQSSTTLEGRAEQQQKLVPLLASAKTARLRIRVDHETHGEILFEFGNEVGSDGTLLKSLLIEYLSDHGAFIPELNEAFVSVGTKVVTMRFNLSDESLRYIVSLIALPRLSASASNTAPSTTTPRVVTPSGTGGETSRYDSERYFRAVHRMVEDLRKAEKRATDYAKMSNWHDRYADQIERLPILGVDKDLATYGAEVGQKLRALSASMRGIPVKVNALEKSATWDADFRPGAVGVNIWGGIGMRPHSYKVTSNLKEVRQKQAEAVVQGEEERRRIWMMIDTLESIVRRQMLDRFGSDFRFNER